MISDENLKQLRAMMAELLEEYGLEKRPSVGALRTRRYRERQASQSVTGKSQSVTASGLKRHKTSQQCTERHGAVNGEAVELIPIVGGEFGVSKELLAELEAAYPQVDVPQTLKEIRVWCIANPSKRKTAKGAARFINYWCERVQNKG